MSKKLKTSYKVHHQIESFFTGLEIQFDKTGEHLFCAHGSSINKISINDGQLKAQIRSTNEDDHVIRFILSPNNELLVIAYFSGLIKKFNLTDDSVEREFRSIHNAPITQMEIDPTNSYLATGSSDGTVKLWNLKNHFCSHNLKGVQGVISCIRFLNQPEGDLLFCSAGDDNVHVFALDSSKKIAKLSTHCSTITDLQFSEDKTKLISAGRDKIAAIWNISKEDEKQFGSVVRTIPLFESVESIAVIEPHMIAQLIGSEVAIGSLFFATIGEDGIIKVWDSTTGSKVFTQNQPPMSQDRSPGVPCLQLCRIPEQNQLCAISVERDLFIYQLPELQLCQQLQGHIDEIFSISWFADNKFLAIACNSHDLKIVEVKTSKTRHLKGHSDIVLCVSPLPNDPMCIVSSSKDCTILVWRFDPKDMSHQIICKATGHTHAIHSIVSLSDESIFFSGGEDTTLKKWILPDKMDMGSIGDNEGNVTRLAAVQTIKAHDNRIDDLAVSPNNQLVASGSKDKTVRVFSVETMKALGTLKGHKRGVHRVQFSPVDQVIVTAADMNLRMWNLNDFTCVKTFQGHECSVLNLAFLTNGLQLVSVGSDGNMKLWDCKTTECIKTIDAHAGNTWALSTTGDENFIVTGGQDEKLTIWRDTTKEEQEERLASLQTQVVQEQSFMNYISKKKWRKALKMAISMENQGKTLNVMREIVLEPEGFEELESQVAKCSLEQKNFLIDCCVSWISSAKNSVIGQRVLNIMIRNLSTEDLLRMPELIESMDQLKTLTSKCFDRYERLVQQAIFVDFFLNSTRIQ